ncbi:MAG: nucleoside triphosphate pyrophosphohydrolase [Bacillota bacterium]
MKLTIAGMGPGPVSMCTPGVLDAARRADALLLQTMRHPVAQYLQEQGVAFKTLDALYENAEDFDALGGEAAAFIKKTLRPQSETVFLVTGEGLWAHAMCGAVLRMAAEAGAKLQLIPGVSLQGAALAGALEARTPLTGAGGVQALFASDVNSVRPDVNQTLVVLEVDGFLTAGAVKLWLLEFYPPAHRICMVRQINGAFDKQILAVCELDRQETDHTASLVVPPVGIEERERFGFDALIAIMDRLRGEGGCPWDREQTHQSLRQYLIEETYEVLEAIDNEDDEALLDELGDVLLQVVFHARIAKEQGRFDDRDVTTAVCQKMLRRHTHIFGDAKAETPEDVLVNWEAIKRDEKKQETQAEVLKSVPRNLPALVRSEKVQGKAAQIGFDWDDALKALEKVFEEAREAGEELRRGESGRIKEEIGDLLFAVVNVARLAGVQSELALKAATEKFIDRFGHMEKLAGKEGSGLNGMPLSEMDALWDRAKKEPDL